MVFKHLVIIHFIYMVARKHSDIFGIITVDKVYVLIDGVCGTLVPLHTLNLLIRREHVHSAVRTVKVPRLSVAYIIVKLKRLILREHADSRYT